MWPRRRAASTRIERSRKPRSRAHRSRISSAESIGEASDPSAPWPCAGAGSRSALAAAGAVVACGGGEDGDELGHVGQVPPEQARGGQAGEDRVLGQHLRPGAQVSTPLLLARAGRRRRRGTGRGPRDGSRARASGRGSGRSVGGVMPSTVRTRPTTAQTPPTSACGRERGSTACRRSGADRGGARFTHAVWSQTAKQPCESRSFGPKRCTKPTSEKAGVVERQVDLLGRAQLARRAGGGAAR